MRSKWPGDCAGAVRVAAGNGLVVGLACMADGVLVLPLLSLMRY